MEIPEAIVKTALVAASAVMDLLGAEIAALKGEEYDHGKYAKRLVPLVEKYAEKYFGEDKTIPTPPA